MQFSVIKNGVVTNIIEAESANILPGETLVRHELGFVVGDLYDGKDYSKPSVDPEEAADKIVSRNKAVAQSEVDLTLAELCRNRDRLEFGLSAVYDEDDITVLKKHLAETEAVALNPPAILIEITSAAEKVAKAKVEKNELSQSVYQK